HPHHRFPHHHGGPLHRGPHREGPHFHHRFPFVRPPRAVWLGWYVRSKLRRRIFVWVGATLAITVAVVVWVMNLVGAGGASWKKEVDRGRNLVGHTFERVWDRPAERDDLARTLAADGELDVTLRDAGQQTLLQIGRPCTHPGFTVPVNRGAAL